MLNKNILAPTSSLSSFRFVSNGEHYTEVIERIQSVKKLLWIGTADIKDLYVKDGRSSKPLLETLSDLVKCGVEIRLIHAKEPGPAFRKDFDRYPGSLMAWRESCARACILKSSSLT